MLGHWRTLQSDRPDKSRTHPAPCVVVTDYLFPVPCVRSIPVTVCIAGDLDFLIPWPFSPRPLALSEIHGDLISFHWAVSFPASLSLTSLFRPWARAPFPANDIMTCRRKSAGKLLESLCFFFFFYTWESSGRLSPFPPLPALELHVIVRTAAATLSPEGDGHGDDRPISKMERQKESEPLMPPVSRRTDPDTDCIWVSCWVNSVPLARATVGEGFLLLAAKCTLVDSE